MKQTNPMRYDCQGGRECFNLKKRPKIDVFAECFPRRIKMGDIDGIVEIGGMALMLEWKPSPIEIDIAHQIMFRNLSTDGKIAIICIAGDAETMAVSHYKSFWKGQEAGWKQANLARVKEFMSNWAAWADGINSWRRAYDAACPTE